MSPPIVVFAMREQGHMNRLLPIVEGFVERGHPVHVFAAEPFGSAITSLGAQFVDLFAGRAPERLDAESFPRARRYLAFTAAFLDEITSDVEALAPALIVYDAYAVPAPLVARQLGLPAVNVCSGHVSCAARYLDGSRASAFEVTSDECLHALSTLRERYGFEDVNVYSYYDLSPDLNIYCEPPQYLPSEFRPMFEPLAFFGSVPSAQDPRRRGGRAAFHTAGKKAYVSFGTIIWLYYRAEAILALETLSGVLSEEGFETIITLGGHEVEPDVLRSLARPGVRVEHYVDQWAVLAEADLFVTHHGLNSTHEAVFQEVPMLSYPFFGDQPDQARRCQELGLAIPLAETPRAPLEASAVTEALRRLERDGDAIAGRLSEASGWERQVMAARDAVFERMLALSPSRGAVEVR